MLQNAYLMPRTDLWFIESLLKLFTSRIIELTSDSKGTRKTLQRFIFGLQRLPTITDGLILSIHFDSHHFEMMHDHFAYNYGTDDEVFRLHYYKESYDCFDLTRLLSEEEKKHALEEFYISDMKKSLQDQKTTIIIEDYSDGPFIDTAPAHGVWTKYEPEVFLDEPQYRSIIP